MSKKRLLWPLAIFLALACPMLVSNPVQAAQTIPYTINFQGRLTDNSGNILADGSYNVKFRIYDALTSGVNIWEEDRVAGVSDNRIQVTNGLFNIQFGDLTALSPTLFTSSSKLYLEVELPSPATASCSTNGCASFTEGPMTPRQPLAAAPYSFNSDTLDGLDSTGFILNQSGQQTSSNFNISGTGIAGTALQAPIIDTATAAALGIGNSFATVINLNQDTKLAAGKNLQFANSGNSNLVSVQAGSGSAAYTLFLPTIAPNTSQCLSSGASIAGQLNWANCVTDITGKLNKNATDTSTTAALTAGNYLYTFGNTSGNASGVLKIDNGANTGSGLYVTGTADPAANQAYLFVNKNSNSVIGNLLDLQSGTAPTSKFSVDSSGNVVAAGTYNTNTFNSSTLTFGAAGAASIQSASGQQLTVDSGTTGTVNLGTGANNKTINIGATGAVAATDTVNISTTSANNTQTINIGNSANASTVITMKASTTTVTVNSTGLTVDGGILQVGKAATDGTQINLALDSSSAAGDSGTCNTTTNQGALYYSTSGNAVRGCINGGWKDVVSSDALGLQLFGVVPDSGATNPGDVAGVTGLTDGPCRVYEGANATTVAWRDCTAYSGGRKVIVAAGTAATSNTIANNFQHLCLTASGGQPGMSATGAETANLSTVSMANSSTSPILCLADIKFTGANSNISTIYDTRTFSTTEKEFASVITNGAALGQLVVVGSSTPGSVTPTGTTAPQVNLKGVVVATSGGTTTAVVNAVVATHGLASVKAISGTSNAVGNYVQSSSTAAYSTTATTGANTIYAILGMAISNWTGGSACAINSNTCAGSILTTINIR